MAGVKHLPSEIISFKATKVMELKLRELEKIKYLTQKYFGAQTLLILVPTLA